MNVTTAALQKSRPLLVGESNPRSALPHYALWPTPATGSGGRLMRALGMGFREYLDSFDRANLFAQPPAKWSMVEARAEANTLIFTRPDGVVIMLGARVAAAFNMTHLSDFMMTTRKRWVGSNVEGEFWFLRLPHPSGRNRAWSDPNAVGLLRRAVAEARRLCE